jgi:NTP pyrophosphatase (non-canonical NTP hydrolase)
MENINNLIDEVWEEIKSKVEDKISKENFALTQTLKSMEELGEIASLILIHDGMKYKIKRKHKSITEEELKKRLEEEIADTMITLFMLSKSQNIDIKKSLKEKIKIEIERWRSE